MPNSEVRYSKLAPLSVEQRVQISIAALNFFSPVHHQAMSEILGRPSGTGQISPFSARDFLKYLSHMKLLDEPDRYIYRLRELLTRLEVVGRLTEVGRGGDVMFGVEYYALAELTALQSQGIGWLAEVLGADFIFWLYGAMTMQITGTNSQGDAVAGSAFIVASNKVITCAHVITDMNLDEVQMFQNQEFKVLTSSPHPTVDVGIIEFSPGLPSFPGIAFRNPIIAEPVYTLGFPRVPLSRQPALIMQRGEITSPVVTLFDGSEVFLYSAIARPGNSGGPILSETGHIVGIVTEELTEKSKAFHMPFHAGIQTTVLSRALSEIDSSITLPIECYN